MTAYIAFMITINLFLASIIFIIGAYILQRMSDTNKWKSQFSTSTKNALTGLSIAALFGAVIIYIALRPF